MQIAVEFIQLPRFDPEGTPSIEYYHANLIGTTRGMTTDGAALTGTASYTAFGERINGTQRRYGYAGAWGYQTATADTDPAGITYATDFTFMHVGHRYYDPATGRFLQRDPIGIKGDLMFMRMWGTDLLVRWIRVVCCLMIPGYSPQGKDRNHQRRSEAKI